MVEDGRYPRTCPYCLSRINSTAEVCHHCTRDVGRLIRAETRVKELEAKLDQVEGVETDEPSAHYLPLGVFVVPFYIVAFLANWLDFVLDPNNRIVLLGYVAYALAFITGALIMIYGTRRNVWVIFAIGFVQPFVAVLIHLIADTIEFEDLKDEAMLRLQFMLLIGLVAAVGSLAGALLRRQRLTKEQFSFSPLIGVSEVGLERVENLALRIGAILAVLSSIVSTLIS